MLEFLQSLEWPGAFAVVGSIGTIVFGIFGYLISTRRHSQKPDVKVLSVEEYEKLHSRISDAIERIAVNEGDLKEARASLNGLEKLQHDHERRDIADFQLIDTKIDRLMDVVVKILQDDRL